MIVDAGYDFAFLGVRVGGDSELWARGGCIDGFRGRCTWVDRRVDVRLGLGVDEMSGDGGWVDKCDGGGTELCLSRDDFDAAAEDVDGCRGGGHVTVLWRCCCRYDLRERMETLRFLRPLLSCSEGVNGFFRW